jgi:DNA processing protein
VPDEARDRSPLPDGLGRGPGEREALLLLRCLLGIRPDHLHDLLCHEGSASAALRSIERGQAGTQGDRRFLARADPDRIARDVTDRGGVFLVPGEPGYAPTLARLQLPPPGIFSRGPRLPLGDDRVSVVGTRTPSDGARDVAADIATHLAMHGVVVVSGGAMGIDAVAHRAALDAGGRSVAVLACGIDRTYPRTNQALIARLETTGTVVSEYPPGVPAEARRFPLRNRLIAALGRAVVIVEGTARSGTRLTAQHAETLGVDIFAVPGSPTQPLAETPLELLRDGARLIRGGADLIRDLALEGVGDPARAAAPDGLPPAERDVLRALDRPMLPDAVARKTSLSIGEAFATLVELELRGLVRGVGGRFERTFGGGPVGVGAPGG